MFLDASINALVDSEQLKKNRTILPVTVTESHLLIAGSANNIIP